jgi:hypothetical protein
VEHSFGLIKGRFPALKRLGGRDIMRVYKSVEALMVLHNIFLKINDNPKLINDFDESEGMDVDEQEVDEYDDGMGVFRRQVDVEEENPRSVYIDGLALRRNILSAMDT